MRTIEISVILSSNRVLYGYGETMQSAVAMFWDDFDATYAGLDRPDDKLTLDARELRDKLETLVKDIVRL